MGDQPTPLVGHLGSQAVGPRQFTAGVVMVLQVGVGQGAADGSLGQVRVQIQALAQLVNCGLEMEGVQIGSALVAQFHGVGITG